MVSRGRTDEVEQVLRGLTGWARGRADVRALALVGSWARGAAHENSDVDVVLLTDTPERYVCRDDWLPGVSGVALIRTRDRGALTERRFVTSSGLEVDLGVGSPAWASVHPLDGGTGRVASDGVRVLHDPDGLLARLVERLRPPRVGGTRRDDQPGTDEG